VADGVDDVAGGVAEAGEGLAALGGDEDSDGAGEVEEACGLGLGAQNVWQAVITLRNPFGLIATGRKPANRLSGRRMLVSAPDAGGT
jgi:hypothetical protein